MLTTEQFKFLTFFTDFTGSGELVHENKLTFIAAGCARDPCIAVYPGMISYNLQSMEATELSDRSNLRLFHVLVTPISKKKQQSITILCTIATHPEY